MQCRVQRRTGQCGDTRTCNDDDIKPAEFSLGVAKRFPYMSLDPIACDRRTCGLAGYRQTQAWMIEVTGNSQHGEPAIACLAAAMPEYPLVVAWLGESRLPGKTRQAGTQGRIRRTAVPDPWHDVP